MVKVGLDIGLQSHENSIFQKKKKKKKKERTVKVIGPCSFVMSNSISTSLSFHISGPMERVLEWGGAM